MSFPSWVGLASGMEKETSSAAKGRALGVRGFTEDGRVFRWSLNASVGLAPHKLVQGPAENSSNDAALDIVGGTDTGVFEIKVITQAALNRDEYKDGWITVDTEPGFGMYKIKSHDAASSGDTVTFKLAENDPLREALSSGTTKVGLRHNPYRGTIVAPTTITGALVGFTACSVAPNQYFWVQEADWALVHTDVAPAVNTDLMFGGTSAGTINARSSALNDIPEISVAHSVDAGAGADKNNFVRANLG